MAEAQNGGQAVVEVSVIIANYNGEKFIADAIRSACRQTLRNIEIIVSDDGKGKMAVFVSLSRMSTADRRRRAIERLALPGVNGSACSTATTLCTQGGSRRSSRKP